MQENWFTLYRCYTRKQESPDIFHLWVAASTIAACLERNVWIDLGLYKVYPNMYVVLIAASAVCRKNKALELGSGLLRSMTSPPPILSQKITAEGLINFLSTHGSKAVLLSDEFSVFLGGDAIQSGLLGLLTDLYDSPDQWSYHTVSRKTERINYVCLNITAGSTADWLRMALPHSAIGGGFTSRVLFPYGMAPRFREPFPTLDPDQIAAREQLVEGLDRIRELEGPFDIEDPAADFYSTWYRGLKPPNASDLAGYYGRKHTHVLKLAMVFSASECMTMNITLKHIQLAIGVLEDLEKCMPEALSDIGSTPLGQVTSNVLAIVKGSGPNGIGHSKMLRKLYRKMDANQFNEAIKTLMAAELIDMKIVGRGRIYLTRDPEGEHNPRTSKH